MIPPCLAATPKHLAIRHVLSQQSRRCSRCFLREKELQKRTLMAIGRVGRKERKHLLYQSDTEAGILLSSEDLHTVRSKITQVQHAPSLICSRSPRSLEQLSALNHNRRVRRRRRRHYIHFQRIAHYVATAHICRRRARIINAEHMQNKWKRPPRRQLAAASLRL